MDTTLTLEVLTEENDRMRDALQKIEDWANAYPIGIFPEPDFKREHEILNAAGSSLDAISASNMRHVLSGIKKIVDAGLGYNAELSRAGYILNKTTTLNSVGLNDLLGIEEFKC